MKKLLIAAALACLSSPAFADAPLDHGSFARSCAPWDGAAVRFEITPDGAAYPQIGVSFFTGENRISTGSYDVPMASHDGNVNYCTAQMQCQLLKSGTVELLDFAPWKTAHIRYDVQLNDGTELKGEAALTGSDAVARCG